VEFAHFLVIVATIISLFGASFYIKDTLKGTTKPNRVSWFFWAFIPLLGVTASISNGADLWASFRVFIAGLIPLMVFLASFVNRNSYWKLTKLDIICGLFCIAGIVIWAFIDSPKLAIVIFATADGFAALPTIVKAWKFPETETKLTYIAASISMIIVIPSIPVWNIENAAFQVYLMVVNTLLLFAVYRKSILKYFKS